MLMWKMFAVKSVNPDKIKPRNADLAEPNSLTGNVLKVRDKVNSRIDPFLGADVWL